jgi:hypothetical protein
MVFKDAVDRELAEQDYQEYSLELEWEQALLDAWEAMQPKPDVEDSESEQAEEPF